MAFTHHLLRPLTSAGPGVDFAAMAAAGAMGAAGATLLSPFPGEGRPGVKVDLRARAAQ